MQLSLRRRRIVSLWSAALTQICALASAVVCCAAGQAICAIASYECLSRLSSRAATGAMVLEALLSRFMLGAMIQVELRSTHDDDNLAARRVFSSCQGVASRVHRCECGLLGANLSFSLSELENPTRQPQ